MKQAGFAENVSGQFSLSRPDWYLNDDTGRPVCTFMPETIGFVEVESDTGVKSYVRVKLHFQDGGSTECNVLLSELDTVDWFGLDQRCLVNSKYRGAKEYIANMVRNGIITAPREKRYQIDRVGIHRIGDIIFFAAGDRIIRSPDNKPLSNVDLAKSSFRLDVDPELSKEKAFEGMRVLISLSPEVGRILVAHVISGLIRTAFIEAGVNPCTVLFVVGESGLLKSHYIPHLVQLYNRNDGIRAVTRFNSSSRFIEDILCEYSDCTAVIDDLHTAQAGEIKRKNEATAEEIIRRLGDDTGRGRMEGHKMVQREFKGNVVYIGEYIIGKASTIPRALVVNITKRPDGGIFDKFQRHCPLLVSTFYYFFIQWYVEHFDDICDEIDRRFTLFRKNSTDSNNHGRLDDAQFYLLTAFMVFLEFCRDQGFISSECAVEEYSDFGKYLHKLVQAQQARFELDKRKTHDIDYLKFIRNLYKSGRLRLAKNEKSYDPDKHDGLIHYGCLCLRRERLERLLREIYSDVRINEVIEALTNMHALKRDNHTGKLIIKISSQNESVRGKCFYGIWLRMLE